MRRLSVVRPDLAEGEENLFVYYDVGQASVSIEPGSQTVSPGGSFNVNVVIDSSTYKLKACHVEVSYDRSVFTVGTITEAGLLGTNILSEPGSGVTDGLVRYGVTRLAGNDPVPVSGALISIEFEVDPAAAEDTYTLDVKNVSLKDENNATIPGVVENDGQVTIIIGGCKGDFDGDGHIGFDDFVVFGDCYASHCGEPNYNAIGDFDNDCDIDFTDFVFFGDVYGT